MIRYIYCMECAGSLKMHPEDEADGFKMRTVAIEKCKVPENHRIEIESNGERSVIPIPTLRCDRCNAEIPTGTPCEAVTMWDSGREGDPGDWEGEFRE